MAREISVRELRKHTARVVAAAVAEIVPHAVGRSPWVSSEVLRKVVEEAGADPGLLDDLAGVRG